MDRPGEPGVEGPAALSSHLASAEPGVPRVRVETLAARHGRDLAAEGVSVLPLGGAHAAGRVLEELAAREVRLVGLCDVGEEHEYRRGLERAGLGPVRTRAEMEALGFFVCDADLEDELIRAVGADAIEEIAATRGDLQSFRTLQKQPAWLGRPREEQLHRWLGSGGRRKTRYARYLVETLDVTQVPRPLARVLAAVA